MKARELIHFTGTALLTEGGSVFNDISPILPTEAKAVYDTAISLLPDGVIPFHTGSTHAMLSGAQVKSAGDMDIMIDISKVALALDVNEKDPKKKALATKKALESYLKMAARRAGLAGLETKIYGINVGISLPVNGKLVQVDFELVKDPGNVHAFHRHGDDPFGFKGIHKQRILASIARHTKTTEHPLGLSWSAFEGLKGRIEDPRNPTQTKSGDLITNDINDVARILLGKGASSRDLNTATSILSTLAKNSRSADEYETKIADAREEFSKDGKAHRLPSYEEAKGLNLS